MTTRNAMQRLAEEGIAARHPGRGSFVAEPPAARLGQPVGTPVLHLRRLRCADDEPIALETAFLVAAGATRRIIDDSHGRLIEATESRYPGDRYALDVWFDVEGPDDPLPDDVS